MRRLIVADELSSQAAEAITYLDQHSELATVFCTIAPFLLDRRSYRKPKFQPCDALRTFVHEGTLTSEPIQSILRESNIFTRFLHDGKFGPSAFGLPVHAPPREDKPKYDVCISYASEDREIAVRLARQLKKKYFLDVFFDEFEQHNLTGHQLTENALRGICAGFAPLRAVVLESLRGEDWTRHELRAARDRAIRTRGRPYIFPVLLEQGAVPEDLLVFYWSFKPGSEVS